MIFMRPGDAACPGRAAGAGGLLAAPAAGPGISPGISPGIMTALAAELRLRGSLRPRPGAGAGRIGGGEQRPEPATVADALSFLPLSGICTGECPARQIHSEAGNLPNSGYPTAREPLTVINGNRPRSYAAAMGGG